MFIEAKNCIHLSLFNLEIREESRKLKLLLWVLRVVETRRNITSSLIIIENNIIAKNSVKIK